MYLGLRALSCKNAPSLNLLAFDPDVEVPYILH